MPGCSEAAAIEDRLRRWFSEPAFVKVAPIADRPVLPEEQALVARAVPRRQHEFATGRWLARQGMRLLGLPDEPIGVGRLREPLWPPTIAGSISHDGGLCAVVLARKRGRASDSFGIDLVSLQRRAGRMDDLAPMFVTHPDEITAMASFDLSVDPHLLLFSLKEAAVKAMRSRLDDFVDMREIEIHRSGAFELRLFGDTVEVELLADATAENLVTAVKVV